MAWLMDEIQLDVPGLAAQRLIERSSLNQNFQPKTRNSILFRFAQPNRKHFYYKQKRQETQQVVEGAASNDRVYLQKSESGHTEYKLQAKEYK